MFFFFVAHLAPRVFRLDTPSEVFFGQPRLGCEMWKTARHMQKLCTFLHQNVQGPGVRGFFMMPLTPPKINMYPKKGSFQKEVSSYNQHFSEDMLVVRGVPFFWAGWKLYIFVQLRKSKPTQLKSVLCVLLLGVDSSFDEKASQIPVGDLSPKKGRRTPPLDSHVKKVKSDQNLLVFWCLG